MTPTGLSRLLVRWRGAFLAIAGAVSFFSTSGPATAAEVGRSGDHVPDVVIVKFRSALDARLQSSPRLRVALPTGLQSARRILRHPAPAAVGRGIDRIYEIPLPAGSDVVATARKLARLPEVEYAEPRYRYPILEEARTSATLATPNDPRYAPDQQYLGLIQAATAWDVIKSEVNRPLVCVVDGGTQWNHEDLLANIWTNPGEIAGNGVDDDGNGFIDDLHGWDFLANDADPRGSGTTPNNADHGTHTGGLLAAVTNNAVGMASASWNPRLMAVNASASVDNFIAYGYEGILYAVDNGASIISCSWGGSDWSQMGQDVVAYAVSQGALVLAAAGNTGDQVPQFPGAFPNVYAVVNVNYLAPDTDTKRFSSTYGTWVDFSAPGTSILSSVDTPTLNGYDFFSGTSMATPIAAAVASLIKAQHPTWNGLKVGEQLRVTCDNIDGVNPGFVFLMGKGRINATRAVTESSPAVRATSWTFADGNANGTLDRGETVTLSVTLHNYRASTGNLNLTLTSSSSNIVVVDGTQSVGSLAEDANVSLPAAFSFTVASNATLGALVDLRVGMTATGYSDFQWIQAPVEPIVRTHNVNKMNVSLAATGSVGWIGFAGEPSVSKGVGVHYDGSVNCLFEGALLVGTDASHLADAMRVGGNEHLDFAPNNQPAPILRTPGLVSAQETKMSFVDVGPTTPPLGVRITSESRAYTSSTTDDFLFLGYRITNTSGATMTGLRAGLFFDWDIDVDHFFTNRADFDAARGMGYAWDTTDPSLPYFGVLILKGGTTPIYAALAPGSFTDATKWEAMTGVYGTSTGPGDVCNFLSTGPFTVAPGDSVPVWFALIGGHTLPELQANADQARALWNSIVAVGPSGQVSIGLSLAELMPNPFSGGTRLGLSVDRSRTISASVYDTRGRRVRFLGDRAFAPGPTSLEWDGRDDRGASVGSGVYFVRLESEGESWIRKAIVLR